MVALQILRYPDHDPMFVDVTPTHEEEIARFRRASLAPQIMDVGGFKVGYLRPWVFFDSHVYFDFKYLVGSLVDEHKVNGIILDIRDGFGGNYEPFVAPFLMPELGTWETLRRDQSMGYACRRFRGTTLGRGFDSRRLHSSHPSGESGDIGRP